MWDDDPYDRFYDEISKSPPEDFVNKVLDDFVAERLRSYYVEHPLLANGARTCLVESRRLGAEHPAGAIVFAAAAVEIVLREAFITPILHGLFHTDHPAIGAPSEAPS
jgi:hypothetical protein